MNKNDILDYVMNTPHNTNRAVLSSMLNQLGGGGSGDGYLGLHTATVNVTFDTSEVEGDVTAIDHAYIRLGYVEDYGSQAIEFAYGDGWIPITELGTPTQMTIPVSDTYPVTIRFDAVAWEVTGGWTIIREATVVSGSATGAIDSEGNGGIVITGDCSLNIKIKYQE